MCFVKIVKSQVDSTYRYSKELIVESIIATLKNSGTIGIAYTYNKPTIFYEFMYDLAIEVKKLSMKNVVVSNGFINRKPLLDLCNYVDAFNIDLKAFDEQSYIEQTNSHIEPVKQTLRSIVKAGKHLEITYLVITDLNDDETPFEDMCSWISYKLSNNIPLHITRYYPQYKLKNPTTTITILRRFEEIARNYLNFVYIGNI